MRTIITQDKTMVSLEEEFKVLESEIEQRLERYKELCDRMGFDFHEQTEDIIGRAEGKY